MPRHIGRTTLFWTIATLFSANVYAQKPARDVAVSHALSELDVWLSSAPSADGWRKYLELQDLRSQVEQGSRADINQVEGVLRKLESGVPGLELGPFVRLRKAVAEWRSVLAAPTLEQLSDLARQAKGQFQPVDARRLDADRAQVAKAAAALQSFLGRGPAGAGWRRYLHLDVLDKQLSSRGEPSLAALDEVLKPLRGDQAGLDLPQFTSLSAALGDYVASLEQSRNTKAQAEFDARLELLAAHLQDYIKAPANAALKPIGADLDWLVDRRQALPLVESITFRLSHPNVYLAVSESFLAAGLGRAIDEERPVRDMILGTTIVGKGKTKGNLSFRLLPHPDVAQIEATLAGVNYSRSTGYNGPAIIWTAGTTRLTATKLLTIDADGIHGAPAYASADADTKVTGIGSSKEGFMGRIVERVATKRVGEQKGNAERIASTHAERELKRQFEAQVAKELGKSNRQFQERFRNPLVRRGQLPHMYFRSTSDTLLFTAIEASGAQLAAQTAAPDVVGNPDISLRLHDSAINNFTGSSLAGETVGQTELEKFALDMLGEVPERLKQEGNKEAWTITFADEDPVTFTVGDGGFELTGRGKKYTSGDRSFPAMNFTVKYKIEKFGQGVKGTRVGDIEILPPAFVKGGKPLSLRETALRNLMSKRLSKIFEPEIVNGGPTELKGQWKPAGPLEVTDLLADKNWLRIGWRQVPKGTNVAQSAPAVEIGK